MKYTAEQYSLGFLRLALGWLFFWAFLDKVWGFGYATLSSKSWLSGVSPTEGFLTHAAHGPFASLFHAMAGHALVDWLFMLGLCLIGLSLLLGIGMRIATFSGCLLVLLMWLSLLPPANNPFLDEHVIYFFSLLALHYVDSGDYFGLGGWWKKTAVVRNHRWLA